MPAFFCRCTTRFWSKAPLYPAHAVKDLVRHAMCDAFHEILSPAPPVSGAQSISERWGKGFLRHADGPPPLPLAS